MNNKLISTSNYLYLVDDSIINNGDYVFNIEAKIVCDYNSDFNVNKSSLKKIIAHLPLKEDSFYLKKLKLLPKLDMNLIPNKFICETDSSGKPVIKVDEKNRPILVGKYEY